MSEQASEVICLNSLYSTTRNVATSKPEFFSDAFEKAKDRLTSGKHKTRKQGGLRAKNYFKKDLDNNPLISIVTVVRNGEKHIEQAILSVLNQSYDNIEYIVIDGDSSDKTLEIIKKYENQIDYWVSKRDGGIYDAMNKGIMLSSGSVIGILNSDDCYVRGSVEISVQALLRSRADYSYAKVGYIDSNERVRTITPLTNKFKRLYLQEMPYSHISAFVRDYVYKKVGLFSTAYKIAGDHDMAVRIYRANFKATVVDEVVGYLRSGGISNSLVSMNESLKVAMRHGKKKMPAYLSFLKSLIKYHILKLLPQFLIVFLMRIKKSRHL